MKRYIFNFLASAAAVIALTSCEKEGFFNVNDGVGQFDCSSLNVDYINSGSQTRATGVSVKDFSVNFVNQGNEIVKSYIYSDMPEVVALPVGDYTIEASYGDNPIAEWNAPYYLGQSATSFSIKAGQVTSDVDPVECRLSNIAIRVNINDLGLGILGDDVQVVVSAGQGSLKFTNSTNDKVGYFRFVDGSRTIAATFSGTVDGVYVDAVTRLYDDAASGNSYQINFTVTRPDEIQPGDIQIGDDDSDGINVDATISIKDENYVIDPEESEETGVLVDDMRPVEDPATPSNPGNDNSGSSDDPTSGDEPSSGDDPASPVVGPQVTNMSEGLILNGSVDMDTLADCMFDVESATGITGFNIHIESGSLTPEELDGIGLAADFDLVNPGAFSEALSGLGFPVGEEVEGANSCHFDITTFLGLLGALGPDEHKFHLTVTDAEGTLECYIGLIKY